VALEYGICEQTFEMPQPSTCVKGCLHQNGLSQEALSVSNKIR
jgi:hypothetical protein